MGGILHDLEPGIPTACRERGQVRKTRPLGRGPCTAGALGFSVCVCVCACVCACVRVCIYHVSLPSLCFPRPAVATSALTPPARPRPPAPVPVRQILTLLCVLCRMFAQLPAGRRRVYPKQKQLTRLTLSARTTPAPTARPATPNSRQRTRSPAHHAPVPPSSYFKKLIKKAQETFPLLQ
jgi:hypothetical protein